LLLPDFPNSSQGGIGNVITDWIILPGRHREAGIPPREASGRVMWKWGFVLTDWEFLPGRHREAGVKAS
jgi:hypothetical protein